MKIRWTSGKGTKVFDVETGKGNPLARAIVDDLQDGARKTTSEVAIEDVLRLKHKIEVSAARGMRKFLPYVAKNLIGLQSGGLGAFELALYSLAQSNSDELNTRSLGIKGRVVTRGVKPRPGGTVHWSPLSIINDSPKNRKRYPNLSWNNRYKFFLNKGTLRRYLAQNSDKLVAGTGTVQVDVKTNKTKLNSSANDPRFTSVGTITIRIAPHLTRAQLPALSTGRWNSFNPDMRLERSLGFKDTILQKLEGPTRVTKSGERINLVHRPLLQPALGFWLLHYLPTMIARTILRNEKS